MIISASRRTDIPAFYGRWFINRIRDQYCLVANPYNRRQVSRISLERRDVDCIVFWTRYPVSIEPYLSELEERGYPFYFLITVVSYPRALEPDMPKLERRIGAVARLAERIGSSRIVWRYDPIIMTKNLDAQYHVDMFAHIAESISRSVERVVVSFVDMYSRIKKQMTDCGLLEPSEAAVGDIANGIVRIAQDHNLIVQSCAEKKQLDLYGVTPGACIDSDLVSIAGGHVSAGKKDPAQRKLCRCMTSRDIGVYNTCLLGCRYCYATKSRVTAQENYRVHDPKAPSIIPL